MATSGYVSTRPPRGVGTQSNAVATFEHRKEAGYHYRVAEHPSELNNFHDMPGEALEQGFELVEEGPRKNLYRIPISEHDLMEKGYRDEANARLRAKGDIGKGSSATETGDVVQYEETVNRLSVSEGMTGAELVAGMKE